MGERSWLRPAADALGWVDAYVERMLMAVILVKDEIEQRRFLVQPFAMLSNDPPPSRGRRRARRRRAARRDAGGAAAGGAAGELGGGAEGAGEPLGSPGRAAAPARGASPPPMAAPSGRLAKMASRIRRVWGKKAPKGEKGRHEVRQPSSRGGLLSAALSLSPFGSAGGGALAAATVAAPAGGGEGRRSNGGFLAAALALTPFGSSSAPAPPAAPPAEEPHPPGAGAPPAAARAPSFAERALDDSGFADVSDAGAGDEAGDYGAPEEDYLDWYQGGPQGPAAKLAKLPPK